MGKPFMRRVVDRLAADTKLTNLPREFFAFEWSSSHTRTPEVHVFPDAKHRDAFVALYPEEPALAEKHGSPGPDKTVRWRSRAIAAKADVVREFNEMTWRQKRTNVIVHTYL